MGLLSRIGRVLRPVGGGALGGAIAGGGAGYAGSGGDLDAALAGAGVGALGGGALGLGASAMTLGRGAGSIPTGAQLNAMIRRSATPRIQQLAAHIDEARAMGKRVTYDELEAMGVTPAEIKELEFIFSAPRGITGHGS